VLMYTTVPIGGISSDRSKVRMLCDDASFLGCCVWWYGGMMGGCGGWAPTPSLPHTDMAKF